MCGIIVSNTELTQRNLHHRGPDKFLSATRGGWFFDHFRLSIQDLSESANQPFWKESFEDILVYNGEIYNTEYLRGRYLLDVQLETSSDTEVLFELLRIYGVDILNSIDGMFAFVFYNGSELIVSRDRLGIKPLFVYESGSSRIFSSELSVILENIDLEINEELLPEFIKFKYVGPQSTIYKNVRRFEPGTYEVYRGDGSVLVSRYYDLINGSQSKCFDNSEISLLENALKESVTSQLISDVPLSTQLSGGIDSTIIREYVPKEYNSYSSIFSDVYTWDERKYIQECAIRNGVEVTYVTFTEDYFSENLHALLENSGGVNHPHTLAIQQIAHKASERVKVLLSGEGADELFMGYERYKNVKDIEDVVRNAEFYSDAELELYFNLRKCDILGASLSRRRFLDQVHETPLMDSLRILELRFHLQNLLERYDLSTMRHGVEGRVPFLSNGVMDFALSRSASSFMGNGILKAPLKALLSELYSEEYVYRNKVGYRVPINEWLFRDWFYNLVADNLDNKLVKLYIKEEVISQIRNRQFSDLNVLGKLYWTILNLASL